MNKEMYFKNVSFRPIPKFQWKWNKFFQEFDKFRNIISVQVHVDRIDIDISIINSLNGRDDQVVPWLAIGRVHRVHRDPTPRCPPLSGPTHCWGFCL